MYMSRSVATGETRGAMVPLFNFQAKQGPTFSVSNVKDTGFYGCSKIMQIRNFTIFTVGATIFGQLTHLFSNCEREIDHFMLDHLKSFDT